LESLISEFHENNIPMASLPVKSVSGG